MEEVALKATAALRMASRTFHGLQAVLESNKQYIQIEMSPGEQVVACNLQRENPLLPFQEKVAKEKDKEFSRRVALAGSAV